MRRKSAPKPKSKTTPDDPKQSQRFIEAAKAAEADERPEVFEKAFRGVTRQKKALRKGG